MLSQEFTHNTVNTNMQQQANTLQVNQVNAQVTNVFNDEQQQLLTLQVTAAAAAHVAEAQIAAQIQVAAADNVVQQQNAHIAHITQAAQNAHHQYIQERLQLQEAANNRVTQLELELYQARRIMFATHMQGHPQPSPSTPNPGV